MKMELIEGSETSAIRTQTPGKAQKKTYYIQNTAKLWNQEHVSWSSVIGTTENRSHLHGCMMVMNGVMCFWHVSCLLILLIQDASNVVWGTWHGIHYFLKGYRREFVWHAWVTNSDKVELQSLTSDERGGCVCVCTANQWCNSPTWNSWVWKERQL